MLRKLRKVVVAGMLVVATSPVALAGAPSTWNHLGRKLGLGWSDGYHAYNGCEGNCGWVATAPSVTPVGVAVPATEPTPALRPPAPASSRRAEALRTTQRPADGPVLPSQRSTPKPAYWYR